MEDEAGKSFAKLVEVIARLREPGGCPWDRAQTQESLTPYILEEAYELVEAISRGEPEEIREELGDLLLQVVLQARLAEEKGDFNIAQVAEGIREKMIHRHPHVFGDAVARNPEEVKANWARLKREEGKDIDHGVLGKVPRSAPALLRARRLTERAAAVGFDWPDIRGVLEKLEEEWNELKAAIKKGDQERVEDEFGDVLFVLANLSRFLEIDPERALSRAVDKFVKRFRFIEERMKEQNKPLEQASLEEMDALWDLAKRKGF